MNQSEKKVYTHNLFFQRFNFIIIIVPVHENDAIAKSLTDTHPKLEWIPEGCWWVPTGGWRHVKTIVSCTRLGIRSERNTFLFGIKEKLNKKIKWNFSFHFCRRVPFTKWALSNDTISSTTPWTLYEAIISRLISCTHFVLKQLTFFKRNQSRLSLEKSWAIIFNHWSFYKFITQNNIELVQNGS